MHIDHIHQEVFGRKIENELKIKKIQEALKEAKVIQRLLDIEVRNLSKLESHPLLSFRYFSKCILLLLMSRSIKVTASTSSHPPTESA